ncbi:hypothetical protein [uncultured Nostoc sp.]|uniref:hypothetical protein n=1 Tax=uncultured Nostoc sp. TaxID=340711 RepID=UPI002616393E|nr:hypothetical protein [uncultured Nostoc sp.]
MIGITLSVNYLSSDCADRSLGSMKLAITDYNLSNPDNYCVGAARRRHRIHFGQVFEYV